MSHPDEMLTAAYLEGGLPPAARDRFEDHLAGCEDCRAGIQLLRSADEHEGVAAPPELIAGAKRQRANRRPLLWAVACTAAIVVAGCALFLIGRQAPPAEPAPATPYRGEPADAFAEISPAPGAVVPLDALAFRWGAVPGADRYVVRVSNTEGDLLASIEVRAPGHEASWPADRPLPPPGPVVWRLRALVLDRLIAETRPVPFEVR